MSVSLLLKELSTIFRNDIFYVRAFRDHIEVRNVRENKEVSKKVISTFSDSRLLIADFFAFENQLRETLKDASQRQYTTPSSIVIFQPMDELNSYSFVEKRTFRDSCEHAGAKQVYLYLKKDLLSNEAIYDGIEQNRFES